MWKPLVYTEAIKNMKNNEVNRKMRKAHFLCEQCGAPFCLNLVKYSNMFGLVDEDVKVTCEYCDAEYTINPYRFIEYCKDVC